MKAVELGRPRKETRPPSESDNLFGWSVFILLLCGFAAACWIGTIYVFSHPEEPFNYSILSKLDKLDPPKRFELTAAPPGEFLGADKLMERFGTMTAGQLNEESAKLLRSYLQNYSHLMFKVPYVTGKFTVLDSYKLEERKYFPSGVVVIAQSVDIPALYLEHVFPASKEHMGSMERTLTTGLGIELRRSYDLSAVIHVENLGNGRLLLTAMPLLYGPYGTTGSGSGFQLDPPGHLNAKAGLPIVAQNQLRDAEQRFAQFRKATGGQQVALAQSQAKTEGEKPATPAPTPALVQVARALPVNPSTPAPAQPTPAASQPTATPVPRAVAVATPRPSPAVAAPPAAAANQPPQPTLTASPTPAASGHASAWQTYRPSRMPRGRLLDVDQTLELADRGVAGETMYLRGDFTVTAARENRAVLRPRQSLPERVFNRGNARVIVEYPRGLPTPREGDDFQRSADRPFQIVEVRRGADGQVNIYVREVTTPQ
jgi:hypothetical protein